MASKVKQQLCTCNTQNFLKPRACKIKNNSSAIVLVGVRFRMDEYVKGAEPDRWHWSKSCKHYPRVVIQKRSWRPSSDLCDDCLDIERVALRKMAAA